MKKHPVDDLFKRKLEGLERTPSENAWLKIQGKQPVRNRPIAWGWYAAAGVAAAVMGGYLVWQNQQVASPGNMKSQQAIAAARPAQNDPVTSPIENSKAPVEQLTSAEKKSNGTVENSEKGFKQSDNVFKAAPTQVVKATNNHTQNIQTPVAEPVQNAPVMALNEKISVPVNAIQPETVKNPVTQDVKTLHDEPAVSQANKPEPEPTRTIVAVVETGPNEAEEKPRNTRFARVFRQLKNARAGEKVDWDEVGFNPKNLVARVDDRLRGKDERSSDKDHPKNKTKL